MFLKFDHFNIKKLAVQDEMQAKYANRMGPFKHSKSINSLESISQHLLLSAEN